MKMKQYVLLSTIALVLNGINASGQTAIPRVDSSKLFQVLSPTDSILIEDAEYIYDPFGNRSEYLIDYYSKDSGEWYKSSTEFQEYDRFGNIHVDGYQGIYPDQNSGRKTEYLFNEQGVEIARTYYWWPDTAKNWVSSGRDEYVLNSFGRIDSFYRYIYDTDSLEWYLLSLWVNLYDKRENPQETVQYRPGSDSSWIPFMRNLIDYDSMDRLIEKETSFWDTSDNAWLKDYRMAFEYNTQGKMLHSEGQDWDEVKQSWVNKSQEVREYDEKGRRIFFGNYRWNPDVSSWDTTGSYLTTYTESEDYTEGITKMWNRSTRLYENDSRTEYYSDTRGIKVFNRIFEWNAGSDSWVLTEHKFLYYSYQSLTDTSFCQGTAFPWEGANYTEEGAFSVAYSAGDGRDSIRVLNLTKLPAPESMDISGDTLVDEYQDYQYEVEYIEGICYGWIVDNGSLISEPDSSRIEVHWGYNGEGILSNYLLGQNGCSSDTTTLSIRIVDTQIEDLMAEPGYKLYPNPASEHLYLELENTDRDYHTLTIFNNLGEEVNRYYRLEESKFSIDVSTYKSGIYLFRLQEDESSNVSYGKFVVD